VRGRWIRRKTGCPGDRLISKLKATQSLTRSQPAAAGAGVGADCWWEDAFGVCGLERIGYLNSQFKRQRPTAYNVLQRLAVIPWQ
jgi:hypothetical protein